MRGAAGDEAIPRDPSASPLDDGFVIASEPPVIASEPPDIASEPPVIASEAKQSPEEIPSVAVLPRNDVAVIASEPPVIPAEAGIQPPAFAGMTKKTCARPFAPDDLMPICMQGETYYVKAKDKDAFISQKLEEAREDFKKNNPNYVDLNSKRSFDRNGNEIK